MIRVASLGLAILACGAAGCNPLGLGLAAVLVAGANEKETDHFVLVNEPDYFLRRADHHDFHATEVYEWRNCGDAALVDLEVTPSCPNDVTVSVTDAEGTLVFIDTFHAPHCWKGKEDWAPIETARGVPGVWRIELRFDITGVKDLEILITRLGPCVLDVTVSQGNNGVGNGEDPQPPGQPPVNDGDGTGPGHPFARWHSAHTDDRDVTETYYLNVGGSAGVRASWETFAEGRMEVTIRDETGQLIYTHLFAPGHAQPFADATPAGPAGVWSVTFAAEDVTSAGLEFLVEAP